MEKITIKSIVENNLPNFSDSSIKIKMNGKKIRATQKVPHGKLLMLKIGENRSERARLKLQQKYHKSHCESCIDYSSIIKDCVEKTFKGGFTHIIILDGIIAKFTAEVGEEIDKPKNPIVIAIHNGEIINNYITQEKYLEMWDYYCFNNPLS